MLNLYRRYQPPCRYRSRRYRTCNCPIWVQGSLRGEYIRRGLNLRSWSAATDLVRDWEATGEIGVVKKPDIPTIAEAVDLFLQDARAQQLSPETIRKYQNLLSKRLVGWCEAKGYRYLKQLGVEQMRQFRATWAADRTRELVALPRHAVRSREGPRRPFTPVPGHVRGLTVAQGRVAGERLQASGA